MHATAMEAVPANMSYTKPSGGTNRSSKYSLISTDFSALFRSSFPSACKHYLGISTVLFFRKVSLYRQIGARTFSGVLLPLDGFIVEVGCRTTVNAFSVIECQVEKL